MVPTTINGLAALLILIGLILVFSIFKPTYRKPGLYKDYDDGHIYVSRKAVEKSAYDTLTKYDQVRQPNVVAKLYNKKSKSYIDIKADFLVPNDVQVKSLTESIRSDIKHNVEYFTELPVRKLEVNVRDRKLLDNAFCKGGITWLIIIIKMDKMQVNKSLTSLNHINGVSLVSLHFNYSNLILTLGFWKTILVIVLCLIGIGVGYIKDRTQDFMNFLNRWS